MMTRSAAAVAALPRDEPEAALLDEVVAQINHLYVIKGLELAVEVGEYLIDRIFDGDPEQFRDRGSKDASFRKLAARDDLKVSHAFLWSACAIVVQRDALPEDLRDALSVSHHRALLPLKDEASKVDLARRAVEEGLSKRELQAEVERVRAETGAVSRAGRPPLPAVVKGLNRVAAAVRAATDEAVDVSDLPPEPGEGAGRGDRGAG